MCSTQSYTQLLQILTIKQLQHPLYKPTLCQVCYFLPSDGESKLQAYISSLSPYAQSLLDKELDWDNSIDKDLVEIANKMIDWEEKGLHTLLELDRVKKHDIKRKYRDELNLQRYVKCEQGTRVVLFTCCL